MIDASLFVVIFLLIVLLIVCSCRNARENEEMASEELRSYREHRQRIRLEERRRAQAQEEAPPNQAEVRRRREEIVKGSLFSRTLGEGESINSLSSMLSAASERYKSYREEGEKTSSSSHTSSKRSSNNFLVKSWRSASSSVRSHHNGYTIHGKSKPAECSICLDRYESGDVVSWAKNDGCNHLFHEECIVEWLRDHDDCPLCRTKLIVDEDEDVDEDGREAEEEEEDAETEMEEGV